jgi:hypothetical protein
MPTKNPGDVLTSTLWNTYLRDNIDKLLTRGHRVLTVAQFGALTGPEGTKGTVAPDEVYLEVDSTNGIQWHLGYESGEPTYKWRFLGGPPLYAEVATAETTASAVYAALATAGPAVAVPRAGDFDVEHGAMHYTTANGGAGTYMSYDIGATGAVDGDAVLNAQATGVNSAVVSTARKRRKAALTAVTLTAKYRASGGTGQWQNRYLTVTPVRLI